MDSSHIEPAPLTAVDRTTLQQLVVKLLQRKGMFVAEAEIVAERMIEADLYQRFAEGVGSLFEFLETMDLGDIDPRARVITVKETAATALLDGSTGMGHVATTHAMRMAIEKATDVGMATIVVKNSRPGGDLGGIALLAAKQGLIGMVTSSAGDLENGYSLAWSIPATDGAFPVIHRQAGSGLDPALTALCGLLSAGLAGADPHPRKRKASRTANTVEYSLLAIHPDKFGTREALIAKWGVTGPAIDAATTTVSLQSVDAEQLSALAAKIKFAVNW
ncbi:MAG: Ldh family oxidoreductase [Planctomycetes bacterium]|nr:Ldh family oxidoreductase [Planctomycetota bacterium]